MCGCPLPREHMVQNQDTLYKEWESMQEVWAFGSVLSLNLTDLRLFKRGFLCGQTSSVHGPHNF